LLQAHILKRIVTWNWKTYS